MTSTTLRLSSTGHRVALRDHGAGDPVVLIHGVGLQSAAWGPQIEALARTHRVLAIDLPGHGGSAPLPPDSRLPEYVEWLREALAVLGLVRTSIAGHSMGALIACGFATRCPDTTARVALLNGVYKRSAEARAAVEARAAAIAAGEIDLETPLNRWFGSSAKDQAARAAVAGWLRAVDPGGYATAYRAFAEGDSIYADRLRDIRCPLLALTGDGDPNSTPDMARAMAAEARNGRAEIISGHRHMVNLTAPDQVSARLLDWLHQDPAGPKRTRTPQTDHTIA